nr:PREDICTED: DNA-directed RNA polymerase III subunit rpc3-like isoform X2 [Daucus carota subsp. sativus]
MALFHNIIHHMRFPKFIAIVNEELGKECEEIFVWLLQDGRLSVNDIVERQKEPSRNSTASDALHECFRKLVNAQYVERCPAHEPFLAPPTEEETAAKKRAAKFTKTVEDTIEARALAEASPMDSVRFLLETDTWTDDPEQKSNDNSSNLASAGEKRKLDALESETKLWATNQKKEVLWRVNFEEFVRRLRHKSCIENVRARLDSGAATVLGAVLEATRRTETKVKVESSVPLSIDDIMQEVIKSEEGRTMNSDRVRASLAQLGCDMPSITGIDETYSIDLKKILELAQIREVESIVLKRYGKEASRIFKLLLQADRVVETEMISKDTFVDKKDAAKILHRMWKDDYLHLQVMEKDKGKQKYLLWAVKKPELWQHILDDMYHAALNLRLRSAFEQEKDKEIAQLPREKREGELGKRFDRWMKIRLVLESSLMKLDDAILLFNDF